MYDGMRIYRGIVSYASNTTGDIDVKIPSILGEQGVVRLSKLGIKVDGMGIWDVPAVNSQVLVAVEDSRFSNVYLILSS